MSIKIPSSRSNEVQIGRRIPRGLLALCLLSLGLLSLIPFLQVGDGTNIPPFALFLGRFHPVVLHVPIGLILLAILLQHSHIHGLRQWIPKVQPETVTFLMFCAAMSSVASTVLGWMLSYSGGYDPTLLHQHFIAGMATAIGANVALLLKLVADAYPSSRLASLSFQLTLLFTAAAVGIAGHLGASITHGEDYLTEYAPNPVRRLLGLPLHIDPADIPWKPLSDRAAFAEEAGPILTERCVGCHSGQKAKGGLRLDAYEQLMKGGNNGAVFLAGDPAKSPLLRYIDLPLDDPKHMPPKGKTQVTDDERLILGWWVEAGAPENKTVAELDPPEEVRLALERNVPEAVRKKQDAEKLQRVAQLAPVVADLQKRVPGELRAVAPGDTALEFSARPYPERFGDEQLRALEPVAAYLVSLDLRRAAVTDAGLEMLGHMPNLRQVELQETKTGDAGLAGIGHLASLEILNLYATKVSDKGIESLGNLKKLRRLYILDTLVTDAGKARLSKELPKLEIVKADPIPKSLMAASAAAASARAAGMASPAKAAATPMKKPPVPAKGPPTP